VVLIALGGLPGVGKSTLARECAARTGAVWLRIDSIEQALRDGWIPAADVGPAGYLAGAAVARDNLSLGRAVIADAVNSLPVTRRIWRNAAGESGARMIEIHVFCGSLAEHRRRVTRRSADVPGLALPDWDAILTRPFDPWPEAHRIDTSALDVAAAVGRIRQLSGV
jgi:predicted kinase